MGVFSSIVGAMSEYRLRRVGRTGQNPVDRLRRAAQRSDLSGHRLLVILLGRQGMEAVLDWKLMSFSQELCQLADLASD